VVRNKSAAGISALSFELEALGLIIHTSYGALSGLPWSAYGWVTSYDSRHAPSFNSPALMMSMLCQAICMRHVHCSAFFDHLHLMPSSLMSCTSTTSVLTAPCREAAILCTQSIFLLVLIYFFNKISLARATLVLGALSSLVAAVALGR
jgi:hypothetical protein